MGGHPHPQPGFPESECGTRPPVLKKRDNGSAVLLDDRAKIDSRPVSGSPVIEPGGEVLLSPRRSEDLDAKPIARRPLMYDRVIDCPYENALHQLARPLTRQTHLPHQLDVVL